jgi:hypothetical protein
MVSLVQAGFWQVPLFGHVALVVHAPYWHVPLAQGVPELQFDVWHVPPSVHWLLDEHVAAGRQVLGEGWLGQSLSLVHDVDELFAHTLLEHVPAEQVPVLHVPVKHVPFAVVPMEWLEKIQVPAPAAEQFDSW